MTSIKLMIVLSLFLTMKATTGQPTDCICRVANYTDHCNTRGCSNGTNVYCNEGRADFHYAVISLDEAGAYNGCNCPSTSFNVSFNGIYGWSDIYAYFYNYTSCTHFGGNARDVNDDIPANANNATDCCNFCCGRNDPYPKNQTIITTTPMELS